MIDAAEKAREDLKATIIYAEREGKHLKQLEIAKKMLEKGLTLDLISEVTGLDQKIIRSLNE